MTPGKMRAQVLQYPSGERFILKDERVTEQTVFVASDETLHATLDEWRLKELTLLFRGPTNTNEQRAWVLADSLLRAGADVDKLYAILTARES